MASIVLLASVQAAACLFSRRYLFAECSLPLVYRVSASSGCAGFDFLLSGEEAYQSILRVRYMITDNTKNKRKLNYEKTQK
jgi:hypothetical protein